MRNFTKSDRIILVIAALTLAAFSYFMYDDSLLFPRIEDAGLQNIGQVSFSANDVRLKTASAFTWFPAQKSDQVHMQDSIFTGDRSEATIQLQDGTILNLKPNSLITLNMNNGQMNLALRYGDLSSKLNGKSALTITAGDKTFDLEGDGSVQIAKPSAGSVDVSVLEGNAQLKNGKDGPQKLDKGKKLNLGGGVKKKDGKKTDVADKPAEEPKIELTTPDGAAYVRLEEQDPIPLEWKSTGDIASFETDTCPDAECAHPEPPHASREQTVKLKDLKPGQTFWRVRGLDKFGKEVARSKTQSVVLTTAEPPVITTPGGPDAKVEGFVKVAKADEPIFGQMQLTWEPKNYYGQYDLEITSDAEFTKPVHTAQTEQGGLQTPPLANGVYYYHVRGTMKNGRPSAWSQPAQFAVDMKPELPQRPNKPVLAKKVFDFNPAEEKARAPASVPKPVLNWSKVKSASNYQVQLSKTPDFQAPISFNLTSESMAWPNYSVGEWHVRVIAINKLGAKSPWSEPSILNIKLSDPILNPMPGVVVRGSKEMPTPPRKEMKASWTDIPLAQSYLFQMAESSNFSSPREFEAKSPVLNVGLEKPGTYFFRVQARDAEGKPITGFSPVEQSQYDFISPIMPPALVEPFDKASIFLQSTQEPFIWLEWKRTKDADFYQVQVARDPEFKNKIVSEKLRDNRFLIQKKIPTGKLYWRVRAVIEKDKQISDWAQQRLFNIYSKKNEAFVE